jgi:two-component system sensor histidine kinase YesM
MKMNIKAKIFLCAFTVTAASLIISGLVVYNYVIAIVKEQAIRDNSAKINQIGEQIHRMSEQVKKVAEYILTDDKVNSLTRKIPNISEEQDYFWHRDINGTLRRFIVLNEFICNAIIVRHDGDIFCNSNGYEDYYKEQIKQPWFQNWLVKGGKSDFTNIHTTFLSNHEEKVISFVLRYKNMQDEPDLHNFLILDIPISRVHSILRPGINDFDQFFLLNRNGDIIYGNPAVFHKFKKKNIGKAPIQNRKFAEDRESILFTAISGSNSWKQIAVISKRQLFHKTRLILVYFIIIILLSIFLIVIVFIPIILNITRPISQLMLAMKKVSQGNLETSIAITSGDELQILGEGFNKMVDELKENMAAIINDEKIKRKMQNDLLMAQINPHFIYNTMNLIIFLIDAERYPDAVKITGALIDILQDTVKIGDDAVFSNVGEEIKIIEKYLHIQYIRYPDTFSLEMKIAENLWNAKIPRMIIQPLVENALFHGIHPAEHYGHIELNIQNQNGEIVIQVNDDGIGMAKTVLENIFTHDQNIKTSNQTRSIGIKNIKERLKYLYGDRYQLAILSNPGTGCQVTIRLPSEFYSP